MAGAAHERDLFVLAARHAGLLDHLDRHLDARGDVVALAHVAVEALGDDAPAQHEVAHPPALQAVSTRLLWLASTLLGRVALAAASPL